jgi:hypothetical protein
MSFIYCHLNFHANLLRPWAWRFPLTSKGGVCVFSAKQILLNKYNDLFNDLNKQFFNFICDGKPEKIKRNTLIADFEDGGLKMIRFPITYKIKKLFI